MGNGFLSTVPPNGRVMDEAMLAADAVVVPSSTGPADMAKTFETADVMRDRGIFHGVLFTMVHPRTAYLQAVALQRSRQGLELFRYVRPGKGGSEKLLRQGVR